MMAPYTIAHLKLAMTFKESGIDHFNHRLGVYLTNTLDEGVKEKHDLFSFGLVEAISEEAKSASVIKNDTPIMVIIGNPPYSGESFNKGAFAMKLVEKYKFEPGGVEKLREKNSKWINDDYVKFLAFAEEMITKTGEGIVAMITNHAYLDNPTFRGMRWHLTKTFSSIYVLDLHGNAKKKETTLEGGQDKNVFDIQQGVAIIIAVKNKTKRKDLANVYRADIWGTRKAKFEFLLGTTAERVMWKNINLKEPFYFFQNTDDTLEKKYSKGIKINELFLKSSIGIQTHADATVLAFTEKELKEQILSFYQKNIALDEEFDVGKVKKVSYRPFDKRFYYEDKKIVQRPRLILSSEMDNDNLAFCFMKQYAYEVPYSYSYIANTRIIDRTFISNKGAAYFAPLYLYSNGQFDSLNLTKCIPNLNLELVKKLILNIGNYKWVNNDKEKKISDTNVVSPLDILDYIYASLHSPMYREKYKDFLKSDFPHIPVASDEKSFWKLVELGCKLRQLHLMEDPELSHLTTTYPLTGDNLVDKVEYRGGRVFINDLQFFGDVSKEAWEFHIGGYQPAQKWLKDRKGKNLTYEDIMHYQKIITVLTKTIEVMSKIDQR